MAIDKLPKNAKEIPDFPGYYATPSGDIWSGPKKTRKGFRKLRPGYVKSGHGLVRLCIAGICHARWIHRIILHTFIGECPKGMECCHNNGMPADNRLKNLRWDTRSSNAKDAFKHGTRNSLPPRYAGEKHPRAKLTRVEVEDIKQLLSEKKLTQKEIGLRFGVARTTITGIHSGQRWSWI